MIKPTLILTLLLLCLSVDFVFAQSAEDFAAVWDKQHVSRLQPSDVRHADLKDYLSRLKTLGLKTEQVGASNTGREIYQIEWGKGATKVFMWSQMHGDEPTATSALIDLFTFLQNNRHQKWVAELENSLTIRAVPMLNPDGAELYQRRNLQGIDINRDARNLSTPEGKLLKKLRDEWQPEIGFNLHNQNELTAVGKTGKQAAISLLAVSGDPQGKSNAAHLRSKRMCAVMIDALEKFMKGNLGRYDDEYNPRAFGDRISEWGTPVILIETGALYGKDELFLVKMNFVAYLAALRSIVDRSEQRADASRYDNLPFNSDGNLYGFIFRQAQIVSPLVKDKIFSGDIAVNLERRRRSQPAAGFIREIGDLSVYRGLEEYDARNFHLVPKNNPLHVGAAGEFLFYKKSRKIDWNSPNLEKVFPPDAIFENGKWTKGGNLLPRI